MGFFSKLFGGKEEKKTVDPENLPVQSAELKGRALFKLGEILEPSHKEQFSMRIRDRKDAYSDEEGELVDRIHVWYAFDLEYAVFDEDLFKENVAEDDPGEALNELFYVCLTAKDTITVKIMEGDRAAYEEELLAHFDDMLKDWGIKGTGLRARSFKPDDADKEFYEAYKSVWR